MAQIIIPWEEAQDYIDEADILLFKAPSFPSIGYFITAYTGGSHSHVGLAHWDDNRLYCVEQREFKGGRSVNLETQVRNNPGRIDVYRVEKYVYTPEIIETDTGLNIKWYRKAFGAARAKEITNIALEMTGEGYGWKSIWEIFKCYAPGFRLLRKSKPDDELTRAFVCSTLCTYAYRMSYIDLCPNLSDTRTSPADISRSAALHYLFTIGE